MQSNARRLVLLFGLMAVAMATKTAVKVEEKDIGDVAGAALTAGSGLLNPGQLGLMALGTVIKAGTNFFQAMKNNADWAKKENEAMCGMALQTYRQTTDTLRMIKITGLIGQVAMSESDSEGSINQVLALAQNTQNMCDLIVESRAKAFAKSEFSCRDKPAVRANFALLDMELGTFSCAKLFRSTKLKAMASKYSTYDATDAVEFNAGGDHSSSYEMVHALAQKGAFSPDLANANIMGQFTPDFLDRQDKVEAMTVITSKKTPYKLFKLVGDKAKAAIAGDNAVLKELVNQMDNGYSDMGALGDLAQGQVDGAVDAYVKENIIDAIVDPAIKSILSGVGDAVDSGLKGTKIATFLPESINGKMSELLGGVSGQVAGILGKEINKIIDKKLKSVAEALVKSWQKKRGQAEHNEGTFNELMCAYYRGEASESVKTNAFMAWAFNHINQEQASPNSAFRLRMALPQKACELLFTDSGEEGVPSADGAKACVQAFSDSVSFSDITFSEPGSRAVKMRIKDIINKLIARYSDGNTFDNNRCNNEMCLGSFRGSESVPACTVLCNHANAIAGMEFPDDHWFEAITISDSLTKFVRLAATTQEESSKVVWDKLIEYCPAPSIRLQYDLQRRIERMSNKDPYVSQLVNLKPSGGKCVPDSFWMAQGMAKAIAAKVSSDYAAAVGDAGVKQLRTAHQILQKVQLKHNEAEKNCKPKDIQRVEGGYDDCLAQQYGKDAIKPAIVAFCAKVTATRSDGEGNVADLCRKGAEFMTSKPLLLAPGAEHFELMMIENTGIYGYEIMFSHYAFETIPGAKSELASTPAHRGDMEGLQAGDDIPERVVARTISNIQIRQSMGQLMYLLRSQVVQLIMHWDENKERDEYASIVDTMSDAAKRTATLKDIAENGMPYRAFWVDEKTDTTHEKYPYVAIVQAALEVLPTAKLFVNMAETWKNMKNDPMNPRLDDFGLDCTYTDIRYFQMLQDAEYTYTTAKGDTSNAKTFKGFLATFELSLRGSTSGQKESSLKSPATMNPHGKIFAPYYSLLGGSTNWIRWRSTPGFEYLRAIYVRSTYPEKSMPEELFYTGELLASGCVTPGPDGDDANNGKDGTDGAPAEPDASSDVGNDGKDGTDGAPAEPDVSSDVGDDGKDGTNGAPAEPDVSSSDADVFLERRLLRRNRRYGSLLKKKKKANIVETPKVNAPGDSDKAKLDLAKKMEQTTDKDCKWSVSSAKCTPADVCEYRYKVGDYKLSHSCRAKDEGMGLDDVSYNPADRPTSDKGCKWSVKKMACYPKNFCEFRKGKSDYIGDCRLIDEDLLKGSLALAKQEASGSGKMSTKLIDCGIRSVIEAVESAGVSTYDLCTSPDWETDARGCTSPEQCSNAPAKKCSAAGFGWQLPVGKDGKPIDIEFSVPVSAKGSAKTPGEYQFVSMTTPQPGAAAVELSGGGVPKDETAMMDDAICAMCKHAFHDKFILALKNGMTGKQVNDDCQKVCQYYVPTDVPQCLDRCRRFVDVRFADAKANMHTGERDIRDMVCSPDTRHIAESTVQYFKEKESKTDLRNFLNCRKTPYVDKSASMSIKLLKKDYGASATFKIGGAKRSIDVLLTEYKQAIAYEFKKNEGGMGFTADPCDMTHLRYCRVGFTEPEGLWSVALKSTMDAIAAKKAQADAEANKPMGDKAISFLKYKCTYDCMAEGNTECEGLQKMIVRCASDKCDDDACKENMKQRCIKKRDAAGAQCAVVDTRVTDIARANFRRR